MAALPTELILLKSELQVLEYATQRVCVVRESPKYIYMLSLQAAPPELVHVTYTEPYII